MNQAARQHIFISYRRDDARGASGRLYDWLRIAFGSDKVFRDVASIGIGKWRDKIDAALADSAVCIAVIGQRWANADNLPRLHDANDMVRHELLRALGDGAMIMVPALVENAPIPAVDSLPAELRPLFDIWNARPLREDGWEDDMRRLIGELAEATGLTAGPDIDTLIRAQQRVAELEQAQHLQTEQVAALRTTIDELTRKLADATPAERPGLAAAFAELAQGRAAAAEDAFEREYDAQAHAAHEARRTMAEAARNVANLAMLRDVAKAVAFFRKALDAEPDDAETARLLGFAMMTSGDLAGAKRAFEQSLATAEGRGNEWGAMSAHNGLGDVAVGLGNLGTANAHFRAALSTAESQCVGDLSNTSWQRDRLVSHHKIGDVLMALGDGQVALSTYRKGLGIAEALAARDPANTEFQRDLAASQSKIGDVLVTQGDGPGALAAYRKGLAIAEALATRDPANLQRKHDLLSTHNKVGDVLVAQGDGLAALDTFHKCLNIAESLAAHDPVNTQWQRNLSVCHNRIGDVQLAQGDGRSALTAFRKSHAILEELGARDSANTQWQHDLSVSFKKIGDVLVAQNDNLGALATFREGLAIAEALAARDPANSQWQRDLSVSHNRIGNVRLAQGDRPGALDAFYKSHVIFEALAAHDPTNSLWQRDLSVSLKTIGDALVAHGDRPGALDAFRRSYAILEGLATRDPANSQWQRDISVIHNRIGDMLVAQGDWTEAFVAYRKSLAIREALAARDPANAEWQRDLIVGNVKLAETTGNRNFLKTARQVAESMQQRGVLAPCDAWMIDDLRRRLEAPAAD